MLAIHTFNGVRLSLLVVHGYGLCRIHSTDHAQLDFLSRLLLFTHLQHHICILHIAVRLHHLHEHLIHVARTDQPLLRTRQTVDIQEEAGKELEVLATHTDRQLRGRIHDHFRVHHVLLEMTPFVYLHLHQIKHGICIAPIVQNHIHLVSLSKRLLQTEGSADCSQTTKVHDAHHIRQRICLLHGMSRQQNCVVLLQFHQRLPELRTRDRIHSGCWLVQNNRSAVAQARQGDRELSLHTTGEGGSCELSLSHSPTVCIDELVNLEELQQTRILRSDCLLAHSLEHAHDCEHLARSERRPEVIELRHQIPPVLPDYTHRNCPE